MKNLYFSLFETAPHPFICRAPTRHEWLGSRLVILAPDVESVYGLAGNLLSRAEGLVLTFGNKIDHQAIAPLFFHMTLSHAFSPEHLSETAPASLQSIVNIYLHLLESLSTDKAHIEQLETQLRSKSTTLTNILTNYEKTVNRISEMMEAQKHQKERLANIIEGTHVGTWEWNVQTGEYLCNERWAEMLGYSLQELAPKVVHTIPLFAHPDDVPAIQDALEKHFAGQTEYCEYEMRVRHKLGYWVWIQTRGKVISHTPEGKPLCMFGTNQDISERKQYEEKISRMNEQLAGKNKDLEQILYVASHDLRAPLVNISGFSQELSSTIEDARAKGWDLGIIQEMSSSLDFIQKSAEKMDTLLAGLLKLSRLGRAALCIGPLDMQELMQRILAENEFLIRAEGVTVRLDPLPNCVGDAVAMNQVLTNLLTNAIKYRAPERPLTIHIYGQSEDGRSIYCVEDNGLGIAPEHKNLVFEIFHRLHTSKADGEGLGLAIVRQSLDRMGGEVWLESEIDKGSTFFVAMPKTDDIA